MLSNAYFHAKFRFDTAENEPAKNLQNFRKCIFEKCGPQPSPAEVPSTNKFRPGEFRGGEGVAVEHSEARRVYTSAKRSRTSQQVMFALLSLLVLSALLTIQFI